MPYLNTRRMPGIFNRKVAKYLMYRKAKKMYSAISKELSFLEDRFLRTRARA